MASSPGTPPQESPNDSLKLTDLPVKFLEKVINKLDVTDWLIVRNVSYGFRKLIDESEARFPIVTVHMNREDTEIHIGDQTFLYPFRITRITQVPYLPNMQVLMKFLTNCKIEQFEVKTESEHEVLTEFVDLLESSNLKIRAKKFRYSTNHPDLMILILQHLNLKELAVLEPIEGMEQHQTEMTEHLQLVVNNYILNCAISKYRVYHSYGLLSKILGNFKLPFIEFEWKYYQHYNGNSDLMAWKRSEDMNSLSEKMKGFKKVMDKLNIIDRLILRKTSREMRKLVDGSNFQCDEIVLHFGEDYMPVKGGTHIRENICFIRINNWDIDYNRKGAVSYSEEGNGQIDCRLNVSKKFASDKRKRLDMMCEDAKTFLKNPNWKIKKLEIKIEFRDASDHLIDMIQSLDNQIHVEKVEIEENPEDGTLSAILPILLILNPDSLKEISLDCQIDEMKPWREIWETEQWKKAEIFEPNYLPNEFPFEKLSHFKKIQCSNAEVNTERLIEIRDILIKSAHFESLHINKPTLRDLSTNKIKRIMSENPMYIEKICGFLIPNSKDYFRLYLGDRNKVYDGDDGRSNFGIERIVNKGASVDSEVENDYPHATELSKFILKAALKKEPDFESYKEWDENEENPKIDFLDFEWRYYEFYHGKRDFSIERRPESSLTFNDLTNEVLAKVVEKTDMFHRLVLRKVSRNLRGIVDETNANCKEVLLYFGFNEMYFGWEKEYIKCIQAENEDEFKFEVHRVNRYEETETKELNFSKEEFARMMIADVTNFLKTPNLKIGKFAIHTTHDNCQPLFLVVVRFLKSLNFKIPANELIMPYNIPFHEILQYFDPNCLKKLCSNDKLKWLKKLEKNKVSNEDDEARKELEKVMKMEIWTKIESFEIDFRLPDNFPIEKFFNLKEITIKSMELSEERLIKIRDNLLKSPQFERACFPFPKNKMQMENVKTDNRWSFIDGIMSQDAAYDSGTHRFSIPDSQEYFQLNLGVSCCHNNLYIRRTLEKENSDDSDKNEDDSDEGEDDSDEDEDSDDS